MTGRDRVMERGSCAKGNPRLQKSNLLLRRNAKTVNRSVEGISRESPRNPINRRSTTDSRSGTTFMRSCLLLLTIGALAAPLQAAPRVKFPYEATIEATEV